MQCWTGADSGCRTRQEQQQQLASPRQPSVVFDNTGVLSVSWWQQQQQGLAPASVRSVHKTECLLAASSNSSCVLCIGQDGVFPAGHQQGATTRLRSLHLSNISQLVLMRS
jgi:hypothetical protein